MPENDNSEEAVFPSEKSDSTESTGRRESEQVRKQKSFSGSACILVVEDDEINRSMFTQLLKSLGYIATTVASAEEAFEYYKNHHDTVDCVMTDMIMPGMNGITLAKKLIEMTPKLPIIIMTGYSDHVDQKEIFAVGCNALIAKPILRKDLGAVIAKVLEKKEEKAKQ